MKLLKAEALERDTSIEDVLTRALEAYFAERLEAKSASRQPAIGSSPTSASRAEAGFTVLTRG